MIPARLIVDFGNQLMLVSNTHSAVGHFAARIICLGKAGGKFHCGWTEQRRIDTVVHKRRSKCDLPAGVAAWRGEGGEVACEHRRRWNEGSRIIRILAQCCALIAAKEKQSVLDQRSTGRTAELVALQCAVLGR